jgi:hypothetical protein
MQNVNLIVGNQVLARAMMVWIVEVFLTAVLTSKPCHFDIDGDFMLIHI